MLLPRAEDAERYARFLAEPRTGIFRLLADAGCEAHSLIVKADEQCLNQIPESSFYSFREDEHTQKVLSDIRLKDNHLISDGILSQGILVNLGDIALENVTTTSDGLGFLNRYAPESLSRDAQKQEAQLMLGIESDGYEYKKTLPVSEKTTYALRVIAYKGSILRTFRGYRFDLLAGDKRTDLTIALRVVRKDKDGSVTIVWRELARREAPRLKIERKKQLVKNPGFIN